MYGAMQLILFLNHRLIQGAMFGGYCKTYSLQTSQNYILHHLIEVYV